VYRPFPFGAVCEVLKGAKAIGIMDRAESFGSQYGPLALDIRSALYDLDVRIPMRNYIYGLGGADVTLASINQAFNELQQLAVGSLDGGLHYLGIR